MATVKATLPSGQKINVTIKNGRTQTAGLPPGTVVHTGGGDYRIGGGFGGNYQGERVGGGSSGGSSGGGGGGISVPGASSGSRITTPSSGGGGSAQPPQGYLPVRQTGESVGAKVDWNPQQGVLIDGVPLNKGDYTIINGVAYAKPDALEYALHPRLFAPEGGGLPAGATPEQQADYMAGQMGASKNWDIFNNARQQAENGQTSQAPVVDQSNQWMTPDAQQWMNAGLQQYQDMINWSMKQSADIQAMVFAGLEATLAMINKTESDIVARFQNQMGEDDPQLRAAIGLLREEVQRQRDMMLEEMNARGLSQSGILLEMTDRMNRNELTQIQSMVAGRIGDLQAQLNAALMGMANARINAVSQYQGMSIQAAQQGQQNAMTAMGNYANAMMGYGAQIQAQANWQKGFDSNEYWNAINQSNQLWQNQFAEQQANWQQQYADKAFKADQWWKQKEYDLAKQQNDLYAKSLSSGGGGGGGSSSGGLSDYQAYQISAEANAIAQSEISAMVNLKREGKINRNEAMEIANSYKYTYPGAYQVITKWVSDNFPVTAHQPNAGGAGGGGATPQTPRFTPNPATTIDVRTGKPMSETYKGNQISNWWNSHDFSWGQLRWVPRN